MAFPVLGALGISAGSSILGGLFNSGSRRREARKQRAENRWLAEYQYTKDLEMWNRQNEYNNPKAQMQRLKDAGLNPNLIYGSGSVTGNTSTQLPKYQRPEVPRASMELNLPDTMSVLNMYQDYKNKGVQHDMYTKQMELMDKDLTLKEVKRLLDTEKTFLTMSQRSDLDNTIGFKIKKLEAQARSEWAKTNIVEKDWKRYRDTGLSPNTPWQGKLIEDLFRKYIKKHFK